MPKTRHKFTPAEDAQILAMKQAGKTFAAIAEALNLPESSIGGRCRLLLVGKRTPKKIGRPPRTAAGQSSGAPGVLHRWSAEEDEELLHLRAAGNLWKDIAGVLGVSPGAAAGRLSLLKARQDAAKNGVSGMVRCLGPDCGKQFLSPDKCRIRLCATCKRASYSTFAPQEHALRL